MVSHSHPLSATRSWPVFMLAAALLLGACSGSAAPSWNGRDISGLMPDLAFTLKGENGQQVNASDFAGVKLLYFGYTHCPDICPATLARLAAAIHALPASARGRVKVLFVSVDPKRDTPAQLKRYTRSFGPEFMGLSGSNQQLQALAKRYRSAYGYGEKHTGRNYEVMHSSAVYVFDADNHIRLLLPGGESVAAITADLTQLLEPPA